MLTIEIFRQISCFNLNRKSWCVKLFDKKNLQRKEYRERREHHRIPMVQQYPVKISYKLTKVDHPSRLKQLWVNLDIPWHLEKELKRTKTKTINQTLCVPTMVISVTRIIQAMASWCRALINFKRRVIIFFLLRAKIRAIRFVFVTNEP